MEEIVITAEPRTVTGKQVKALRRAGKLPAVIYGLSNSPITISLDQRSASRILTGVTTSHLVTVEVSGGRHTTLVRERQRHPVTGSLLHIDFQEVSLTETLRTTVPLETEGEAPAVKNLDGVVVVNMEEVEVECLPGDLPERILVDLSGLAEIGSTIFVRDLNISNKVTVLEDPNEIVVVVTAPISEAQMEALEGAAPEPEVIERGKKEEEEEEF